MSNISILENEVHIWKLSLTGNNASVEELCESVLSDDERERAEKLRFSKDRENFILTRGHLRALLSAYLGKEPEGIELRYGRYGKPYLDNESNPGNINFNLSHSSGKALYAITKDRDIGIDIEFIRPVRRAGKIIERFFSDEEKAYYAEQPEDLKTEAFFKLWCGREAYTKAIGTGFNLPGSEIAISFVTGDSKSGGDTTPKGASDLSLHEITAYPGYAAWLSVSGPSPRISYMDIE